MEVITSPFKPCISSKITMNPELGVRFFSTKKQIKYTNNSKNNEGIPD